MRRRTVLALGVLALAGGCGTPAPPYLGEISLLVPGPPECWGDGVARSLKSLIEARRWAGRVLVTRDAGGGGASAVGRFAVGRPDRLMVADPLLLADCALGRAPDEAGPFAARTVPLARLAGEWQVLVASPDSGYRTFEQVAAALLRTPERVKVAGGPDRGPGHLLLGLTARGLGADPRPAAYEAFDSPARAVAAVAEGTTALAFGGRGDVAAHVRAGRLRPLAVSAPERLPGLDAPTLTESGVRVAYANWTGLLAPLGVAARERDALIGLCRAVADSPAWLRLCERNGWTPMWLAGEEFRQWLTGEARRTALLLDDLGIR
ncbi:Bug family tripartite tricarboxylate transporter substrate binding protein [Microbispora sp. H10949]|uniref:Bug family tripartite tricarboxylate transporter substrate binding protein n=1 Tax=Microbispora sp. H10949 TaxID=2729111 RepID=UPI001602BC84|nr:tripartite tricarboxylate transporter substrate-binding protein [Microbispora sp. H10949]